MKTGQTSDVVRARAAELYETWKSTFPDTERTTKWEIIAGGGAYTELRAGWEAVAEAVLEQEGIAKRFGYNEAKHEEMVKNSYDANSPRKDVCTAENIETLKWAGEEIKSLRKRLGLQDATMRGFIALEAVLGLVMPKTGQCFGEDVVGRIERIERLAESLDRARVNPVERSETIRSVVEEQDELRKKMQTRAAHERAKEQYEKDRAGHSSWPAWENRPDEFRRSYVSLHGFAEKLEVTA